LPNFFQNKSLLSWIGILTIIGCLSVSSLVYASGEEIFTVPTLGAITAAPHPGSITSLAQVQPSSGQVEPSGATDDTRQNLYATIAGFLVAGIPVYFFWRRKRSK